MFWCLIQDAVEPAAREVMPTTELLFLSQQILDELEAALHRGGIRAALAVLNSLVGHRFTAMYRYDGSHVQALNFFDREHPDAPTPPEMYELPATVTYCVYVRDTSRPFVIADALRDDRLEGHPSRQAIQAYCGVPLQDEDGHTLGSLCHFDFAPVSISEDQIAIMEALAPLLRRYDQLLQKQAVLGV